MVAQRLPDTPFCNRAILEQDAERAFFDRTAGWTLPNTFFGDHVLVEKGVDTALFDELARHKVLEASATHTLAALPHPLTEAAAELRGRMVKTLAYNLEGDAQATAQIAGIRAGKSYLDLANALALAATMYRTHHAAIEHDRKNYRPGDVAEAHTLSEQILRQLGVTSAAAQTLWKGYAWRAATLLFQHYGEAIKIGRFLWSHDDPEGRFPTLHSATRSSPRRERKAGGAPAEGASGAPSGQKPADPAVEP